VSWLNPAPHNWSGIFLTEITNEQGLRRNYYFGFIIRIPAVFGGGQQTKGVGEAD
jgi:hypothetical protein